MVLASDRVPHPCFELIRKLVIMVADIIVVYGEYNCVGCRLGGGGVVHVSTISFCFIA